MESNKQEKSNLLKDNPVAKMASGGSWMSKHVSPISMGTPLEGNTFSKAMADNDGDYEKAKASMAPQMNQAPTMNKSAVYKQGEKDKDDKALLENLVKKDQTFQIKIVEMNL